MVTADIILGSNIIEGKELNVTLICKSVSMYLVSIVHLKDICFGLNDYTFLIEAEEACKKQMKCEVDHLKDEIKLELQKAKQNLKNKYPLRYRWNTIKTYLRNPLGSLYLFYLLKIKRQK